MTVSNSGLDIALTAEQYEADELMQKVGHHFMRNDSLTRAEYEAMIADIQTWLFEPAPWD